VEYNSAGAVVARNLYGKGIDEILMRIDATLGTFYYQDDHEGSVTHLTNSTGSVVESYTYDVFGAPTIFDSSHVPRPSSQFNNRFMFTGREYTSTFAIYEYRARAYHPGLGRFTGEDPKGFEAGDYNLFRYCHNDPEDLTDPMGLAANIPDEDTDEWSVRGLKADLKAMRKSGGIFTRPKEMSSSLFQDGKDKFLSDPAPGRLSRKWGRWLSDPKSIDGYKKLSEQVAHVANTKDPLTGGITWFGDE